MVDQTQFLVGEELGSWGGIDIQAGEGENTSLSPLLDSCFVLRRPHEIRLFRSSSSVVSNRDIVVRATNLVLGAVAALWEALITSDMTALAV